MKITIVDNGTTYLPQLEDLLEQHYLQILPYSDCTAASVKDSNAIILSGGHDFPVKGNEDRLEQEIALITQAHVPVFGICFGFELIAATFGAELVRMEAKEKGILDIQVTKPDEIFRHITNFQVYESHRWIVKTLPDDLVALATSRDGVEAFKHAAKPIYAVQFHPEMFVEKHGGAQMIANFLSRVEQANHV